VHSLDEETETRVEVESGFQSNLKYIGEVTWVWFKLLATIIGLYTAIYLLTWIPDIDQLLLQVLHHRSIITHSILLPLLLLLVTGSSLRWLSASLFSAIGIHLSADLLSPSIGYGAIWLPAPMKLSLGEMSKIWLLVNIIAAFYLSYRSLSANMQRSLLWATTFAGFSYGVQNENSFISAAVILFFSVSIGIWQQRRLKFDLVPSVELNEAREAKTQAGHERALYLEYKRSLSWWERNKINAKAALHAFLFFPKVMFNHPKTTILTAIIVVLFVSMSLLTGRNVAVEAVKSGQWVLHSSGGWILQEGGRYVGGTLTNVKPSN